MSRVETRLRYNSGATDQWNTLFEFDENGSGSGSLDAGLSWRILGTTGGGSENFCAYENVVGGVSITSTRNNDNSINVTLTKTIASTNYSVNKPGKQVVGATFTGGVFNADTTYSTHTKADGEGVGDSFTVHTETRTEPISFTVAASTNSSETVFASMHESATNTKVWRDIRVVNTLPPDYRPGQRLIGGTWQSHNRSGGRCHRLVGGQWTEMRTENGGVGTGNPPLRRVNNAWVNQKKVGQE